MYTIFIMLHFNYHTKNILLYLLIFSLNNVYLTTFHKCMFFVGNYIVCAQLLSCVQPFATPGTVAVWAPLLMEFPRQEYWSVLRFPSPEKLHCKR